MLLFNWTRLFYYYFFFLVIHNQGCAMNNSQCARVCVCVFQKEKKSSIEKNLFRICYSYRSNRKSNSKNELFFLLLLLLLEVLENFFNVFIVIRFYSNITRIVCFVFLYKTIFKLLSIIQRHTYRLADFFGPVELDTRSFSFFQI